MGGLFAASAGAIWLRLPDRPVIALPRGSVGKVIPLRLGNWTLMPDPGFVMPPEDERKAAAIYEQQLMRTYVAPNRTPVMLLIAYDRSQSGMLMVHRPESCYPGAGFTINEEQDITVPLAADRSVPGRFLSTTRDLRNEQVVYWTRVGDQFPVSWDDQRWSIAMQNLHGLIPDGVIVRLSTINPDVATARETLAEFGEAMFAASPPAGQKLLAGPVSA